MKDMLIRDATIDDIPVMAELMTELGYPTTREQMAIRFMVIQKQTDYRTLIIEKDRVIAGLAGLVKGLYYEYDGPYVRIVAFVVKESHRNQGVGKALLKACETWAHNLGATALLLTSGNRKEREAAYRFYQSHGFEMKSSGFVKQLNR